MQLGKGSILKSIHLIDLEMVKAQKKLIELVDLVDSSLTKSTGIYHTQNTQEMSGKEKIIWGEVG